MGLSFSLLLSAWEEILHHRFFNLAYHNLGSLINSRNPNHANLLRVSSFDQKPTADNHPDSNTSMTDSIDNHENYDNDNDIKSYISENPIKLEKTFSFRFNNDNNNIEAKRKDHGGVLMHKPMPELSLPEPAVLFSPRPVSELDAAAVKLQKVYKSYRTRRNLADCAVVVEELWWKALDFAALKRSSVSYFNIEKPETAVSRWARARTRAAKVGKGLSKDEKAQKLALQHWLEAIDPRHRYGHNLHMYYDIWFDSESSQPFFYWLDVGDGKEINIEKCPRNVLHRQCIKYLGPKEREAFEVIVEDGKLVYRHSGTPVETTEGSKWIFVLSTVRTLYVGQKKKGSFQHSSFLAGAAITAAGRLVAHGGILEAIWPYSGHYRPTEENFQELISFLEENHVDLVNVKRCAVDDDDPSLLKHKKSKQTLVDVPDVTTQPKDGDETVTIAAVDHEENGKFDGKDVEASRFDMTRRLSCKWTTGTGPRIGCVRDYPTDLQTRALEQVNLSPRLVTGPSLPKGPIPSPRPSPTVRLSPRLAYMGLPSPRTPISAAN